MAEMEPKKSNIIKFPFFLGTVVGTDTITMFRVGSLVNANYRAPVPFDGSIVALQLSTWPAQGTGSLTARAWVEGTGAAGIGSCTLTTVSTGTKITTAVRGAAPVSAGDYLAVAYTSTSFNATASCALTADLYVHVEQN
jgi:hypothetical protein